MDELKREHDNCGIGFICNISGEKTHEIVLQGLEILDHLKHRGACGIEMNNGDGAGIMVQIPDPFFRKQFNLPDYGDYAVAMLFLSQGFQEEYAGEVKFEKIVERVGLKILGWRSLPLNFDSVGPRAGEKLPRIRQAIVSGFEKGMTDLDKERKLYLIKKEMDEGYVVSLSCKTLVYKGMLTAPQLASFYLDLKDPDFISAFAMVHTRFSTNTLPTWPLAHPYRIITHNGEINTLRGNMNGYQARKKESLNPYFPELTKALSDSAIFDSVLESLVLQGVPLIEAIMMMIPDAWEKDKTMDPKLRAFYDYHSCVMEPWDGPACIAFSDGDLIGACLDRNGLRPARYLVTKDGRLIFASETGVLDIPPEEVLEKKRLEPARMLVVDFKRQKILKDEEIKNEVARRYPYAEWLKKGLKKLEEFPLKTQERGKRDLTKLQVVFGYTQEERRLYMDSLSQGKGDPVFSMGNDAALACLSKRPRVLFDFFKQLFAQVTNPPLDAIREAFVTQMSLNLGKMGDLVKRDASECEMIRIKSPLLLPDLFLRLPAEEISLLFDKNTPLKKALDKVSETVIQKAREGAKILILSDEGISETHAAIPSLLAMGLVNHRLIEEGLRSKISIVIKTGEARQVHHFCLLLGYGAGAIYPYLVWDLLNDQEIAAYHEGALNGILKVLSKLGISAVQSYLSAQCFEIVGLSKNVVEAYFPNTPSAIGGLGLEAIEKSVWERHAEAFFKRDTTPLTLEIGGELQWKRGGEIHLFNPMTVYKLQHATRTEQYHIFQEYTDLVDRQNLVTLRGLLDFKYASNPIPIEEVESEQAILKRFAMSGMSFGAISQEVHSTLAAAMKAIGGQSNSGEGGEPPGCHTTIHQVASARFGVTSEYLANCDALQIKMAQGAKPGEGGQLPGKKVYPPIAKVRHSTPGVELISPPPHHDIYSIEDLAELIFDLKNSNPKAEVHVKLVSESGVGTIAAGVVKARADMVLISGHDGGTGASPMTGILHAGTPWEIGLSETHEVLVKNGLRSRVAIEVDGQLKTGRDIVIAALMGADRFGFGTAPLVVSGCIMMRVCHLNTCPVGVASQDPVLRKNYTGQPKFVETFFRFIAMQVREIMAKLGFRTMDEMIGKRDRLVPKDSLPFDFSRQLKPLKNSSGWRYFQPHVLDGTLDQRELIPKAFKALQMGQDVSFEAKINNSDRATGTLLGYEVTTRKNAGNITIYLKGSSGQSFGAFIPKGVTLLLEGDANDYVGKGLSGGTIAVYPTKSVTFDPSENVIVGNVCLYGATSGSAFFRGIAGDRFCVRNSGAEVVVEGVGDHGCEYMTEGVCVIAGPIRRNFAAGMTGGVAYILREYADKINRGTVLVEELDAKDREKIKALLQTHRQLTGSDKTLGDFVKIIPEAYKKAKAIMETEENWEEVIIEKLYG
ncbi:MAG: glutamate synthase large subunit [Chlamydiia bacterium]|nr:glutamate synthase large subunit [Chlamydiia bacterium]